MSKSLVLGLVVAAVFFGVSIAVGGTAQTGKTEGGRFFLGNRGVYREVPKTAFLASAVYTWASWMCLCSVIGLGSMEEAQRRGSWRVLIHPRQLLRLVVSIVIALGMSWKTMICVLPMFTAV